MTYIFVGNLGRSQIRRHIFEKLQAIRRENKPANSETAYGTNVALVSDNWVTPEEVSDLPAVLFRFDSTEYHSRQSQTLNGVMFFRTLLIVAGPSQSVSSSLDILIDDVIAAMYSNYRSGGYSYEFSLLRDDEAAPTEQGKRAVTLHWQTHYTRSYRIDRVDRSVQTVQ